MQYELRITYCIPREKESALGECSMHKIHKTGLPMSVCHGKVDALIATGIDIIYVLITKEVV